MQESGSNRIVYRKRQMLKQDKIQTFSAIEEPPPDWNDKPTQNAFNLKVFNKSKLFFLLHPGEHMQKYSAYADSQFASSCVAPSWSLNLRWLLLPPSFFRSLFFFPERRFKGHSDQSSLSERKGGRQRQGKKKRMKTPKRTEECANRAVYTNKSSAPQIRSFFFLFRAKFLSDRLNISIDALSPFRYFNFRPPSSSA